MDRSRRNPRIQRILATQEYRGKTPMNKALMLLQAENVSKLEAAETVGVSRLALDRAKSAREDGREIGRNGHPPIFNGEDVTELLDRFLQIRETKDLTVPVIRDVV